MILVSVILILAIWQVWWTRSTLRHDAFRIAFNTEISAEIQDLKVECYYMGGPGDTMTLMRFKAAPDVIEGLLSTGGLSRDTDYFPEYQSGAFSSQQLWSRAFNLANEKANGWWPAAPALGDPLLYDKLPKSTPTEMTSVLWDRATGEVYVCITRG